MGLYTELYFNSILIGSLPNEAIVVMNWLNQKPNLTPPPENLPDHPFFSTPRWSNFQGCQGDIPGLHFFSFSMSFPSLNLRCSLKNYDNEIELFLDWITPYVYVPEHDPEAAIDYSNNIFLGFQRREDLKHPTLLYWHNGEIRGISV